MWSEEWEKKRERRDTAGVWIKEIYGGKQLIQIFNVSYVAVN